MLEIGTENFLQHNQFYIWSIRMQHINFKSIKLKRKSNYSYEKEAKILANINNIHYLESDSLAQYVSETISSGRFTNKEPDYPDIKAGHDCSLEHTQVLSFINKQEKSKNTGYIFETIPYNKKAYGNYKIELDFNTHKIKTYNYYALFNTYSGENPLQSLYSNIFDAISKKVKKHGKHIKLGNDGLWLDLHHLNLTVNDNKILGIVGLLVFNEFDIGEFDYVMLSYESNDAVIFSKRMLSLLYSDVKNSMPDLMNIKLNINSSFTLPKVIVKQGINVNYSWLLFQEPIYDI